MKPTSGDGGDDPVGEMRVFEESPTGSKEPDLIKDQAAGSAGDGPVTFGNRIRTRAPQGGNGPGVRPEEP